ncbi:MAG: hypothetical protein JXO49_01050 [Deltaproteobacteria bacterium]|nr:hypothetical protein [Candidatus Anaeroferrophillus wilburensis]MBN2887913.1 hypothetical protein [Deltaproteobacteria bacterium]
MKMIVKIVMAAVVFFGFAGAGVPGSLSWAQETVLEQKCTSCHATDIIMQQPRSAAEWQVVVARMAGHANGELTRVDQLMVLKYLNEHLLKQ